MVVVLEGRLAQEGRLALEGRPGEGELVQT